MANLLQTRTLSMQVVMVPVESLPLQGAHEVQHILQPSLYDLDGPGDRYLLAKEAVILHDEDYFPNADEQQTGDEIHA